MKQFLIIIPFALPWDWAADYERITACILSEQHTVISFLLGEGISLRKYVSRKREKILQKDKNLYIFRPIYILPFQRFSHISKINFFLASIQLQLLIYYLRTFHHIKYRCTILWTFSLQFSLIPQWFPKKWYKIYDCVDAFISNNETLNAVWRYQEDKILQGVNIVFTNSKTLYQRLKGKHVSIHQVAAGFDLDTFSKKRLASTPKDILAIPKPRIGFIGNISERMDIQYLEKLTKLLPDYSFVFIGPKDQTYRELLSSSPAFSIERLSKRKNVYLLDSKPRAQLPSYISNFQIGIIPYNTSHAFNRFSLPVKTHEYFYMGIPVIATGIPELIRLQPHIYICPTAESASKQARKITQRGWNNTYAKQQKKLAISQSWRNKINQMLEHITSDTIVGRYE
jgi:hypothetical protein